MDNILLAKLNKLSFRVSIDAICCEVQDIPIRGNIIIDTVKLNYDRTSSMLLGMNVLRNFEIFTGDSCINDFAHDIEKGDHILVASPKYVDDKEDLYNEIYKYFNLKIDKCI